LNKFTTTKKQLESAFLVAAKSKVHETMGVAKVCMT